LNALLSLRAPALQALARHERERLAILERDLAEALQSSDTDRDRTRARFARLDARQFAPLTAGLFLAGSDVRPPVRLRPPFLSAFVLSDGSADDLRGLGAQVRSRVGDVFSCFVPVSAIPALEASPAVRFLELTRPLFRNLDTAVAYAQVGTLHAAVPPVTGAGVVVGIVDSRLDIYHPDFRTAANATRVLFLWDQTLVPQGAEASPPTAPALPGFTPAGGAAYGVEYTQAVIDNELNAFNPPATPAYQTVRHGGFAAEHGTHVAGIAAGNGLAQAGTFTGAAPGAGIIFVRNAGAAGTALFGDSAGMADAFAYIFARAAALGQPCVINMSQSDNQGPHDGTTLGEQFLDGLLATPGRAITLSAGNANNTGSHAAGTVAAGAVVNLQLNYRSMDTNGDGVADAFPTSNDDIEIWYDGHDRFTCSVTAPTVPATVIGPVAPGGAASAVLPGGVSVQVTSVVNDPRNGDNLISIIYTVPTGSEHPARQHDDRAHRGHRDQRRVPRLG
jgi:Subtilase family